MTTSPETNLLDLRLWMTIQSSVQKMYHGTRCTHAALAKSVSDVWNKSLSVKTFQNVHGQFLVVLVCVADNNGSNEFFVKK